MDDHSDNGGNWNFTNTPIYHDVASGFQLIGVIHKTFPKRQPTNKIMGFRRVVASLDHVAFESDQDIFALRANKGYEDLAIKICGGQRHFLDDRADYVAGLEELGMSAPLYGVLQALRSMRDALHAGVRSENMSLALFDNLTGLTVKARYHTMDANLAKAIVDNFPEIVDRAFCPLGVEGSFANVDKIVHLYETYLHQFRDANVYAPRLREIQQLPGKKGAIFGANHISRLTALLGGSSQDMPRWPEYVAAAPAPIAASIGRIKEYILEKIEV